MLLVDIGNTNIKLFNNEKVELISEEELLSLKNFYYINVRKSLRDRLQNGTNLQDKFNLQTNYKNLGIDRVAVCSAVENGVVVDAGSAITVDIVKEGFHQGGTILLGLNACKKSFASISPYLDFEIDNVDLNSLPQNTKQAVNFGVLKSLKLIIKDLKGDLPLIFTGGDGLVLSKIFEDSIYDPLLVFKGMRVSLEMTQLKA